MKKSKIKKIVILVACSIILSMIKEYIFEKIGLTNSRYILDKILINTGIFVFIGIHFIFEIKTIYDFIIKYRYSISLLCIILFTILQYSGSSNGVFTYFMLEPECNNTLSGSFRGIRSDEFGVETVLAISQSRNGFSYFNNAIRGTNTDVFSIVHAPVKDILSIGKLFNMGYFFLNTGMGLAFYWNFRLLLLILVSYELFYIITNKKKYISLVGAIVVTFSSAVQWQFSNALIDIIISGELALVLLNKFLISKEYFKVRLLCLIGITICAITYAFTFYPPFMIAFGYIFLAIGVWIIYKNKEIYRFSIKDIFIIIICIIFITLIFIRYFILSEETIKILTNTSYPGKRINNGGNGIKYLFSYIINPFLKEIEFSDNCALASICSFFPIPLFISIYCIINKKSLSFFIPIVSVTIFELIFVLFGFPQIISKLTLLSYSSVERIALAINFANIYMLFYMICNIKFEFMNEKKKIIIMTILGVMSLYSGIGVNPITKSIDGITETNLAHAIQEIIVNDEEALWISINDIMGLSNYSVANGAKVLNSTNIYPNEDFFTKALGKEETEKQKNIWNRYAHIRIVLDDKCYVESTHSKDIIILHLTADRIRELGVKYIITYDKKEIFSDKNLNVQVVYEKIIDKALNLNGKDINSLYIYKIS